MTKFIKEAKENIKFSDWNFYTVEDVKQFLMEQGYNWTKKAGQNRGKREVMFYDVGKYGNLWGALILIGTEDDWGDSINEDYVCKDITKCPFVKFIEQPSLIVFKVYKPVEHSDAGESGNTYELEKDLSLEWVNFLVKLYPEICDYLLEICDTKMRKVKTRMETETKIIAKEIARLQQRDNDIRSHTDNEIKHCKDVIEVINQTKQDLRQV